MFNDSLEEFEVRIREKQAMITTDNLHTLELIPGQFRQVLHNLLSNALSYTPRGGVLLCARPRQGGALIQVWDTGVGIAPDEQEAVFNEFTRVGNAPAGQGLGLGLGLSIVRRLTGLLGFDIQLQSTPGKGSVFSIRTPASAHARHIPPKHAAGKK